MRACSTNMKIVKQVLSRRGKRPSNIAAVLFKVCGPEAAALPVSETKSKWTDTDNLLLHGMTLMAQAFDLIRQDANPKL